MGFIGIRPCAAGLLTDRRVNRDALPDDDRMKDAQCDRFYDQLTKLQEDLPQGPQSWTTFAVRFALADPRIASTAVGIDNPERLRGAVEAVDHGPLDGAIVRKVHQICTSFRDRFDVTAKTAGVPVY